MRLNQRNSYGIPLAIFVFFLLICINPSFAKGPIDEDIADFSKNVLSPILVREGLCTSRQDCRDKEYFFCVSWKAASCDVYGISDERLIKEIFLAMLDSKLKVHSFVFWRSKLHDKSFFEKPLLSYNNRIVDE